MGEQNQEIRAADSLSKASLILAEDLCVAAMCLAQVPVLSLHTFIASDNDNTHDALLFKSAWGLFVSNCA